MLAVVLVLVLAGEALVVVDGCLSLFYPRVGCFALLFLLFVRVSSAVCFCVFIFAETHRHTDTHRHTYRHTETQKDSERDSDRRTDSDSQTRRHPDAESQTHRLPDSQAPKTHRHSKHRGPSFGIQTFFYLCLDFDFLDGSIAQLFL